ncbi:MAG TPA: hypothetical protein VNA20_13950 [Frankiaceae bacterium]|nr:hypothetical protein [Frankiaceae bacterium]
MGERDRWAALFADLEGELEGEEARDLDDEVSDRTRREHGRLALADRLAAQHGRELAVHTSGAGTVRGPLTDSSKDWLLVGETLIPRTAILAIDGLGPAATEPDAAPKSRLPVGYAVRALGRDHPAVIATLLDGRTVTGGVGRVGRDHVDVGGQALPFRAIATLRPA